MNAFDEWLAMIAGAYYTPTLFEELSLQADSDLLELHETVPVEARRLREALAECLAHVVQLQKWYSAETFTIDGEGA